MKNQEPEPDSQPPFTAGAEDAPAGTQALADMLEQERARRRQAEDALRGSEERYRALLATSPDAIAWSDLNGSLTGANQQAALLYGVAGPQEMVGRPVLELVAPEDRARAAENLRKTIETGNVPDAEYSLLRGDGSRYPARIDASLIRDAAGRPLALIAVIRDLTARKHAEAALQKSEAEYRALVENINDVVFSLDSEGRFTYISPVIERFAGYAPAEVLGQPFTRFVHPEDLPALHTSLQHTLQGRLEPYEFRVFTKDGRLLQVRTFSRVQLQDERVLGLTGVMSDITERKRIETALLESEARLRALNAELEVRVGELRELDRTKDEFVSNVSHELRTPYTNIKLYLGLLEHGSPDKRAQYMATIHREMVRLEKMIEDLLDLSRLDRGVTRVNRMPVDVNQVLQWLISDREALAAGRGLALAFAPASGLPPALADATLLTQVMSNLLTNAIQYTPAGGSILVSTATGHEAGREWVVAAVRDTGPGISATDMPHLFQRFYRGEAGRSLATPGTGLGLSICKEIVERLGGRITVDSEPGQGAAFRVWLPAAASP